MPTVNIRPLEISTEVCMYQKQAFDIIHDASINPLLFVVILLKHQLK